MKKRKNTRINTLFSEAAHEWIADEADICNLSLAAMVRQKIELAQDKEVVLKQVEHIEKVIKKSHTLLAERIGKR